MFDVEKKFFRLHSFAPGEGISPLDRANECRPSLHLQQWSGMATKCSRCRRKVPKAGNRLVRGLWHLPPTACPGFGSHSGPLLQMPAGATLVCPKAWSGLSPETWYYREGHSLPVSTSPVGFSPCSRSFGLVHRSRSTCRT